MDIQITRLKEDIEKQPEDFFVTETSQPLQIRWMG